MPEPIWREKQEGSEGEKEGLLKTKGGAKGRRPTTRCSGAREAQFSSIPVRPFARPLNGSVRPIIVEDKSYAEQIQKRIY